MKKSAFNLLIIFIIGQTTLYSQGLQIDWAKSISGTGTEMAMSVAVDTFGNVYTAGYFRGTTDFDPGAGVYNLTSVIGSNDVFVQKLDKNGGFVWAKKIGHMNNDRAHSIALDDSGNVYVLGIFSGTVDFDPGPNNYPLKSADMWDMFILKLDTDGDFVWAKQIGAINGDYEGYSIAVDASGNVFTTGYFSKTVDFDPGPETNTLFAVGSRDIFVLKLDRNGNFIWAKRMGSTDDEYGYSINTDRDGNVLVTGTFRRVIDFDPGPGEFRLSPVGNIDAFVLKLDNNGNFVWAKRIGGSAIETGASVAVDHSGNAYVTGFFWGTIVFDSVVGVSNITSNGGYDAYVLKIDSDGEFIWAKNIGGKDEDYGNCVAVDILGNVYVTGHFKGTADFDPGTGVHNLSSAGDKDAYILKLDIDGNFVSVKQLGGTNDDNGISIFVDQWQNVYTVGPFRGTANINPGGGSHSLTSAGNADSYVLKLKSCSLTSSIDNQTACDFFTWIDGVTYFSNNNLVSFTLTNSSGCDSLVKLNLTIHNSPLPVIIQNGHTLSTDSFASYQWYFDGAKLLGEESKSLTATADGIYTVSVTDGNNCIGTSDDYNFSTVSVNIVNFNFFKVYPNPSQGVLFIEAESDFLFSVYDIHGRFITKGEATTRFATIENLSSGLYIIRLQTRESVEAVKVLVE